MNSNKVNEALKLKEEGMSLEQIGKQIGENKTAVYRALKDFKKTPQKVNGLSKIETSNKRSDLMVDENDGNKKKKDKSDKELKYALEIKKMELQHAKEMFELESIEKEKEREYQIQENRLIDEINELKRQISDLANKNFRISGRNKDETDNETDDETLHETDDETLHETTDETDTDIEIPDELTERFADFVSEILSLQNSEIDEEKTETISSALKEILNDYKEFAADNDIEKSEIEDYVILKEVQKEIKEYKDYFKNIGFFQTRTPEFELPKKLYKKLKKMFG